MGASWRVVWGSLKLRWRFGLGMVVGVWVSMCMSAAVVLGATPEIISFRTLPTSATGLPDGRAYEMVTPADNHDADVHTPVAFEESLAEGTETELPFQVSLDGSAVTYIADPTAGGFGNGPRGLGNQFFARRQGDNGWEEADIQPRARSGTYYQAFSSDLSSGILGSGGEVEESRLPPLALAAPGEGYDVLYECSISEGPCTTPEDREPQRNPYRPLFGKPLNREAVGLAAGFGAREGGHRVYLHLVGAPVNQAVFAGASADFEDLFFEADDALPGVEGVFGSELEEDVTREIAHSESSDYLYERTGGAGGPLSVANVLPSAAGGTVAPNATFGAPPFDTIPQSDQPDFSRVISGDGERVFWTDLSSGVVYVRVGGLDTVQVSAGPARYWTASTDGLHAIYTEEGAGGTALYRFDLGTGQRVVLAGESAHVAGVIGASEDAQDVYFVAESAVGSGGNSFGVLPINGQPNLYVSQEGKEPVFVATLSEEDGHQPPPFQEAVKSSAGEYGDWLPGEGQRTARVTSDGGGVVFMSDQRLASVGFPSGYPNEGLEEVYLYRAASNQLFCVSCSSSGEPSALAEDGAAAFLPISWSPVSLPQWVSDDGNRVFFESIVPLVPQDTNDRLDVYEWEREGSGGCAVGSGADGGCVYLLTDGANQSNSWLLGASTSGADVFVVTRAELATQDENEAFDVYDARVGGVKPPSPPACTGSGCQGVPAPPPVFATPPSVTFEGVGDFAPPKHALPKHVKGRPRGKPPTRAQKLDRALKACSKVHGRRARKACRTQAHARYARAVRTSALKAVSGGREWVR